ncbi:MAG TPA: helix-turn-helix domain-containing protein [Rariglobus sp.]|jgi:AraC-like DNA-binding protein|nr:helix-turn-helix domain-containing protein [Rariglobus sp.]
MSLLAQGINYFGPDGFPVTVRRVATQSDGRPSHPHDVTLVEHYHDFTELVIVCSGQGLHVLEGESFPVAAGDVFVVQGKQAHYFRECKELILLNVMYDPARLDMPVGLLRRLPGYSALFLLEPNFRRAHQFSSRLHLNRNYLGMAEALADRMDSESCKQPRGHEAFLLAGLVELTVFLSRLYGDSEATEARALLRMGQLISTLEQRFKEPWTLEQMAKETRLSRTGLLRIFRQATGQPPVDYLISLRVEAAMKLLRQTNQSITEIAFETGFSDSNYFARQFRRICGCTPTEFRRRSGTPN